MGRPKHRIDPPPNVTSYYSQMYLVPANLMRKLMSIATCKEKETVLNDTEKALNVDDGSDSALKGVSLEGDQDESLFGSKNVVPESQYLTRLRSIMGNTSNVYDPKSSIGNLRRVPVSTEGDSDDEQQGKNSGDQLPPAVHQSPPDNVGQGGVRAGEEVNAMDTQPQADIDDGDHDGANVELPPSSEEDEGVFEGVGGDVGQFADSSNDDDEEEGEGYFDRAAIKLGHKAYVEDVQKSQIGSKSRKRPRAEEYLSFPEPKRLKFRPPSPSSTIQKFHASKRKIPPNTFQSEPKRLKIMKTAPLVSASSASLAEPDQQRKPHTTKSLSEDNLASKTTLQKKRTAAETFLDERAKVKRQRLTYTRCIICGSEFSKVYYLRRHYELTHPDEKVHYTCMFCTNEFTSAYKVRNKF